MFSSVIMLPSNASAAFNDEGRDVQSERKLEHMSKELQLSADQKAKLEAIFNEKHEKFRAIREEAQNRIKGVLSEEQITKWDELKKQRYEKRRSLLQDNSNGNP